MNNSPVFIVDDDSDDWLLIKEVWEELEFKNPLQFFNSAESVLKHLKQSSVEPFIIISDVNLGEKDGFYLREKLINQNHTKYKTIPFIFFSSSASNAQIKKAYDLSAHGFFIKDSDIAELKKTFRIIVEYWFKSKAPELR